ncbi:MAG: PEGA domain-containing protein [Candidatus Kerfeldbacteria bacterium]|nr:PEGA domain-containing protein [Candidatus Kerfeldbacteria bacterium]
MTKRSRQLYFSLVVLASAIILPGLLLYSSGYRVDWRSWTIERTGSLRLTTVPSAATVSVLELNISAQTPVLMNQLFPGTYTVQVTKPGYMTWLNKVTITAQQTVQFDPLLLFSTDANTIKLTDYPNTLRSSADDLLVQQLSPNVQYALSQLPLAKNYQLTQLADELYAVWNKPADQLLLVQAVDTTAELTTLHQHAISVDWNDATNQLLYATEHELYVYDVPTQRSRLVTRLSSTIREAHWHPLGWYAVLVSQDKIQIFDTRVLAAAYSLTVYQGTAPQALGFDRRGTTVYFSDNGSIQALRLQ